MWKLFRILDCRQIQFGMEEIGEGHLRSSGITPDESLLSYTGPAIRVTNGVMVFLKQRYGVKPSFSIFRRLAGVHIDEDYRGEAFDRDVFRRRVRQVQEKYERLDDSTFMFFGRFCNNSYV